MAKEKTTEELNEEIVKLLGANKKLAAENKTLVAEAKEHEGTVTELMANNESLESTQDTSVLKFGEKTYKVITPLFYANGKEVKASELKSKTAIEDALKFGNIEEA